VVRYFNSVLFNKHNNTANTPNIFSMSLQENYSMRTTLMLCPCHSIHAHKNQKTNEKTQQKNTNRNVQSITTCKKGQQKQRSRFLQEYKSKTSYILEDGHIGRNM
jgi:hypothetical protein